MARLLVELAKNLDEDSRLEVVHVNQRPALAIYQGAALDQVVWLVLRGERVQQVLAVRNPDKLGRLSAPSP